MTDPSPTERLLDAPVRWRASSAGVPPEARAFAVIAAPADDVEFGRQLAATIPLLRAFSRGLCGGDAAAADDLAQDALLKAWRHRLQFVAGTNFKGWLLKIARNHFYSQRRRGGRETPLDDALGARLPAAGTDQVQTLMLNDLRNALNALSDEQREAAILVGAGGFSHRQAAEMCDVPEGTMKSRVCRARARLTMLIETADLTRDAAPASLATGLIMAELSARSEARGHGAA